MINANISRGNETQVISAKGYVPELLTDIAVLVNGIYTQFSNADPNTAAMFRDGLVKMLQDPNSSVWTPIGNQTGIIFQIPDTEE